MVADKEEAWGLPDPRFPGANPSCFPPKWSGCGHRDLFASRRRCWGLHLHIRTSSIGMALPGEGSACYQMVGVAAATLQRREVMWAKHVGVKSGERRHLVSP